jgi:DNA primase
VPLPTRSGPAECAEAGARDGLYRLLEWAATRYEGWLQQRDDAGRAREYLAGRGISPEVARRFRLGYAPEGWDHLLGVARAEGFGLDALVGAGLVLARQTGTGHYDRFRGRLVFPIADSQGRVIGFGGRALAGEEPKYLNSPETPLYQKGQTLYGLHLARERMATARRALLVEGYIDCLMAHQHGFTETVAVLGTALTVPHLGILRRYADEVVLFFDADRAGAEAARRAEELLEQSAEPHWWAVSRKREGFARGGLRLKVATLAAGHDPDTYLRAEGAPAFEARCATARNLLLYALDRIFSEEDTATPRGKNTGMARIALLLSKVQDADEGIALGREAARRLGVDPSDLWGQAQRLALVGSRRPAAAAGPAASATELAPFDRTLLRLLIHAPEARARLSEQADPRDVRHPALRAILTALRAHPDLPPAAVLQQLDGDEPRSWLARLLVEEMPEADPTPEIEAMARLLAWHQGRRRTRELAQALARAESDGTSGPGDLQGVRDEARRIRKLTESKTEPTEDVRP